MWWNVNYLFSKIVHYCHLVRQFFTSMIIMIAFYDMPVILGMILHESSRVPPGVPSWSSGRVLGHRSLPPVFKSRHGYTWRLFQLWLRFIIFGGCSTHLAYHAHKSGHKTSIIIIIMNQSIVKTEIYFTWKQNWSSSN